MTVLLLLLAFVVFLLATIAFRPGTSAVPSGSITPLYAIGAPVIHRHEVVAPRPAANAHDIRPAPRGEFYQFSVIDYLRVVEILADGRVIAIAPNKERLCFSPGDSSFRKARLTERLLYRPRFPHA